MSLNLPPIPPELATELRPLVRAGILLRGAFVAAAEGQPIDDILAERGPELDLAEDLIDGWSVRLGIAPEDHPAGVPGGRRRHAGRPARLRSRRNRRPAE